jgi:hypothetical protein
MELVKELDRKPLEPHMTGGHRRGIVEIMAKAVGVVSVG